MAQKKRNTPPKPPVAVFKMQARTYMPWKLIGNPLADFADVDVNLLAIRLPRGWKTGIPNNSLGSIREWMEKNALVVVDIQIRPNAGHGIWKGLYIFKIGREAEWKLNPFELELHKRGDPANYTKLTFD